MPKLNELELQNVRHLIGEYETSYQNLSSVNSGLGNYANIITQASCPEFRKTMQDIRKCNNTKW